MILEGAIKLFDNNDYTIYTMNSVVTGQYGVVVPKNINGVLNMLIDLHFKNSFDAVGSGIKTTDMLVNEINEEYGNVKARYADGMLVMPMIDETSLTNVIATGDKQKMFDEVKKISAITSELYKKLMDFGVEKQKIDQKIIVVEKNDSDEKFVAWLKEQTPGFIDGVLYSELSGSKVEEQTPVVNSGNSLFGSPVGEVVAPVQSEVEASQTEPVGGIFDNVSPVATEVENVSPEPVVLEPTVSLEPSNVVAEAPITPINPLESNVVMPTAENKAPVTNNDIFVAPSDVVSSSTTVASSVIPEPVVQSTPTIANLGAIEGPKPVESTDLEATALFNPIPNNGVSTGGNNTTVANNGVDNINNQNLEEGLNPNKSNGGFVNLIILVVILIGVTIVSIELGKFLYSVYGS